MAWDKRIPEMDLKQPGFIYSACVAFPKHCKKILKFTETGNLKQIYKNEVDTAYFAMIQHNFKVKISLRELF